MIDWIELKEMDGYRHIYLDSIPLVKREDGGYRVLNTHNDLFSLSLSLCLVPLYMCLFCPFFFGLFSSLLFAVLLPLLPFFFSSSSSCISFFFSFSFHFETPGLTLYSTEKKVV